MGEIWGRYTCVAEEVGDDEDDVEQDGLGDIGEIWGDMGEIWGMMKTMPSRMA